MLNAPVFAIIVAVILGFLSGLGIGGGSLLILWLTLVLKMDSGVARCVNLLFFIVAAGGVSLLRWKKGTLPSKRILPAIIAGCIAAGVFSLLRGSLPHALLNKLFGGILLFVGLRELFYRPKKAK